MFPVFSPEAWTQLWELLCFLSLAAVALIQWFLTLRYA